MAHDLGPVDQGHAHIMAGYKIEFVAVGDLATQNQIRNKIMKPIKNVIVILVGCLMLLGALGALIQGLPIPAFFFLIGGWVCIPALRGAIERRFRLRMYRWHRYVLVIGCWCFAGAFLPHESRQESSSSLFSVDAPSPQALMGGIEHGLDSSHHKLQTQPEKPSAQQSVGKSNLNPKTSKLPHPVSAAPVEPVQKPKPKAAPKKPKPKVAPIEDRGGCTYRGHHLNVGPRGGCYYWAGNSKEYVDRSLCAGCR
jgi:hypothetical protein